MNARHFPPNDLAVLRETKASERCPRHEGPRSFCGCGLPLPGQECRAAVPGKTLDGQTTMYECELTPGHAGPHRAPSTEVPLGYQRPMGVHLGAIEAEILREQARAEQRVLDEIERDGELPDTTTVAALAHIVEHYPLRAALRLLNLEAQVRLQRRHLESLELRVGSMEPIVAAKEDAQRRGEWQEDHADGAR